MRDRRDVSKKNPTGQLKRRGIYRDERGNFLLAVIDSSQTTFFALNCKIVDSFDVNSFA